jgi:hypothetical protein
MTKEEFLADLVTFYGKDPANLRALLDVYAPVRCTYSSTETSPGCAIGRHLLCSNDFKKDLDKQGDFSTVFLFLEKEGKLDIVPKWMQEMPINFLDLCQSLHDQRDNWDTVGLSNRGLERLKAIIRRYGLSEETVMSLISKS